MTNQKHKQLPLCATQSHQGKLSNSLCLNALVLKYPTLIFISSLKKKAPIEEIPVGREKIALRMAKIARPQGEMVCFYEGQSKSTSLSWSHTLSLYLL